MKRPGEGSNRPGPSLGSDGTASGSHGSMASTGIGWAYRHLRDLFSDGTTLGLATANSWPATPSRRTRRPSSRSPRPRADGPGDLPGDAQERTGRRGRLPGHVPGAGQEGRLGPGGRRPGRLAAPGRPVSAVQASVQAPAATTRGGGIGDEPCPSQPTGPDPDLGPIVHEEIDRLPERERLPVVLCDLEGLTYEQAAGQLAMDRAYPRGTGWPGNGSGTACRRGVDGPGGRASWAGSRAGGPQSSRPRWSGRGRRGDGRDDLERRGLVRTSSGGWS